MLLKAFALSLSVLSFSAWASPAHVIIIRHAEKPTDKKQDEGSLSEKGQERAKKLVGYFTHTLANKYGVPAAIYAFQNKSNGRRFRGVETVTPLAAALGIAPDTSFKEEDVKHLVKTIVEDKGGRYDGKTVLICWEHHLLHDILKRFGMEHAPDWPDEAYDRTWIVDLDKDGNFKDFTDLPQHLLQGDSAK